MLSVQAHSFVDRRFCFALQRYFPTTRTPPDATSTLAESSPATETPVKLHRCDRIEVCESGVHGHGVYVAVATAYGRKIIGYRGEHITWKEVLRRHSHGPSDPNYTFYFSLEDGSVIDAKYGGNRTRWINHACGPNCEVREADDRVFIHALRDIEAGKKLFYDYNPVIEGRRAKTLKEQLACRCDAKKRRSTVLAPPEKTKRK